MSLRALPLAGLLLALAARGAPALYPEPADYTLQYWAEGFPGHTPAAPWRRVIQTGRYAFVLDTDTLAVPHSGALADPGDYRAAATAGNRVWRDLPAARLELLVTVDGQVYRATAGGKWSRFTGPRLIESGRLLQRADVTDLAFADEAGRRLDIEARLESVAWPDRLALILAARPRGAAWTNAALEIRFASGTQRVAQAWALPSGAGWGTNEWRDVWVTPWSGAPAEVGVRAEARPVTFEPARGWHRVNLDGVEPVVPAGAERGNDALERVRLALTNATGREQVARLLFEKTARGIRQRFGQPITGISAVLRDERGEPLGLPVQLSKNWHHHPEGGVYDGQWFHGLTQVRVPPRSGVELELVIAYGHWGGVPAASHAQLCLIGWGSNQQWDESALGSWGESICYEPDQAQARASILDVRPLLVKSMNRDTKWGWTHNVGGGDWFRLFDPAGRRVFPAGMRTAYLKQGPCLTEVIYAGRTGEGLRHDVAVGLGRTDDLLRGTYRLRLDVTSAVACSRFVLFQIGADTYSYTRERKMAVGDENGLIREWAAQWGGDTNRVGPIACTGRVPWVSLHEAERRPAKGEAGAWANRGIVIRAWRARLGGRAASPWLVERGARVGGRDTSTIDLVPPPGVTRLEPGDFVDAVIEHLVVPQAADDYYGPNEALRMALRADGNTWRMIEREARGNDRRVVMKRGRLEHVYPDVRVEVGEDGAELELTGGLGHVPVTFTGLSAPTGYELVVDGKPLDQAVHGGDFWQTDHDPVRGRWSRTYNLPVGGAANLRLRLESAPR